MGLNINSMIIDDNKLDLRKFPRLPCPKCDDGLLKIVDNSINHKHPSWIRTLPKKSVINYNPITDEHTRTDSFEDIEDSDIEEFRTVLLLECDRNDCLETISSCGYTKKDGYVIDYYQGDDPLEYYEDYYESYYFFPKMFYPTIKLFKIPENTPDSVVRELLNSFSLYWSNPTGAGVSLRKVLERIVDNKNNADKKKKLHMKIIEMGESINVQNPNSSLGDYLMALKHIGNDASHEEIEIVHSDLVYSYKLIEECLVELYGSTNTFNLANIVKSINETKKPISKQEKSD